MMFAPFETHDVAKCEGVRTLVENMRYGSFAFGYRCLTDAEIESIRQAIFDKLTQIESDLCAPYKEGNRDREYLMLGAQAVSAVACAVPRVILVTTVASPLVGTLLGVRGPALALVSQRLNLKPCKKTLHVRKENEIVF